MTTGDPTRYVLVLRQGADAAQIAAALDMRLARADDFERSSLRLNALGEAEAVVLEELGVLFVTASAADIVRLRSDAAVGPQLMAVHQAQRTHVRIRHSDAAADPELDETDFTWGLQATSVTESSLTGRGVRVAVLDSALDIRHPDFERRNTPATLRSFTDAPADRSLCIHGTAVAGIVAGPERPASAPRYGVAPDCELFFGRVMDSSCSYEEPAVIAGLEWAIRNRCRVANLSLGKPVSASGVPSAAFEEICRRAARKGMIVIAAAGNDSARDAGDIRPVDEPANCLNAFAVGAINTAKGVATFSNGGLHPPAGAIDAVAPGQFVLSAGAHPTSAATRYGRFDFTSMAAPFVTGIAALWLEKQPHLTVPMLWSRLTATATPVGPATAAGAGLVQAPR